MAAGLGFKNFASGEVLTAADVNAYLNSQTVMVFADATARTAAITSPQEGMFSYLKDTNATQYYTGSAWTNLDTTGMVNPMTTTGDTIYSSSGTTPARLGIGTAGQVLRVNSGATAPEWATPASAGLTPYCSVYRSSDLNLTNNTYTELLFNAEWFDSAGAYNTGTGRFTPATAGKYFVIANITYSAGGIDRWGAGYVTIRKNGVLVSQGHTDNFDNYTMYTVALSNSAIIECNGTTDYISIFYYSSIQTGTMQALLGGTNLTIFKVD
jgi:hypothetical protein